VLLHSNRDTELTDVTVADGKLSGAVRPVGEGKGERSTRGPTEPARTYTLKTTAHHPFWDATTGAWVDAAQLKPGVSTLISPNGQRRLVTKVRNFTGSKVMRDLTVANTHTYHVLVGDTPVLVHNCDNVLSNEDGYDNAGALGAHGDGTAFSGIYEPSTGRFRAHLSVDSDMPNPPANAVRRTGGHGRINFEQFGGSRETVGFTLFFDADGFSVSWLSRSVNRRNHGDPLAPVDIRQSIMDAISAATGRKVRPQ